MKEAIFSSKPVAILFTGFIAGTMDILAAIYILAGGRAENVFRFIAKGAFGNAALSGGVEMVLAGVFFHYLIATSFSAAYFLLFPYLRFLQKNVWLSGLIYGIIIWSVMHFIVLPFSHNPPAAFDISRNWKNIVILIFAVGLPVSHLCAYSYRQLTVKQ